MDILIYNPGKLQLAILNVIKPINGILAIDLISSGAANNKITPKPIPDTEGIRLEFAQYSDFTSFDVIRSSVSMTSIADVDLPSPIATGLSTMYYVDTTVVEGATYYYKVRVWRNGAAEVSSEIMVVAEL